MRHIRDCLNTRFTTLYTKAQQTEQLTDMVRTYLPDFLREHCQVLSYQRGCLTLNTHDAAFATQLRYLLPQLRDQLRQDEKWYQLASISITIQTNSPKPAPQHQTQAAPIPSRWRSILECLRDSTK